MSEVMLMIRRQKQNNSGNQAAWLGLWYCGSACFSVLLGLYQSDYTALVAWKSWLVSCVSDLLQGGRGHVVTLTA